MTRLDKIGQLNEIQGAKPQTIRLTNAKSTQDVKMTDCPKASKKITDNNIEEAMQKATATAAVKYLLTQSPIGLGAQSSGDELYRLGYTDTGIRAYHKGAPIEYASRDGGTITVYDDMFMGKTDAGPRTTIYKTERYEQTIIYDELGQPIEGSIIIRDDVANFVEQKYHFAIENGKIVKVVF